MIKIIAFPAMLALLTPLGAFADALNPDPLSVLQAAYATFNVGNVDAAMGFFTSDAELWDSVERRMIWKVSANGLRLTQKRIFGTLSERPRSKETEYTQDKKLVRRTLTS